MRRRVTDAQTAGCVYEDIVTRSSSLTRSHFDRNTTPPRLSSGCTRLVTQKFQENLKHTHTTYNTRGTHTYTLVGGIYVKLENKTNNQNKQND